MYYVIKETSMPAYVIVNIDVHDLVGYEAYKLNSSPLPPLHITVESISPAAAERKRLKAIGLRAG